ncbi:ATP-dependent RNA helicase [Venturia nashicola]|nr:ATP-dependent RNA helicase [Venturia nashicola]
MAILPGFPGLEADILVNDIARKEYIDPDSLDEDSPNTVTTYIEAEADVSFVVQLRRDHRFKYRSNELCCIVSLDGKKVRHLLLKDNTAVGYNAVSIDASYYENDMGSFKKKFFFSTLTTSDAPMKPLDKKLLAEMKALGQITISIHRVVTSGEDLNAAKAKEIAFTTGDISEKALKGKAISRTTKLGPPIPTIPPRTYSATWTDPRDKPFAVFNFRYRSMNDLKAELIVPRSASPVPLEKRAVEDLSQGEMRELLKRQKQQLEEAARVKRESRKNMKHERDGGAVVNVDDDELSVLPAKRRRIETVDLTED